jgi:hypothetical protein
VPQQLGSIPYSNCCRAWHNDCRCAPVEGQYPGVLRALVHRRQKNLLAINLDSTPERLAGEQRM